jgi:hypothetical protein
MRGTSLVKRHGDQSKEWEDPMSNQTTVRPFRIEVPEEDLVELRRRRRS